MAFKGDGPEVTNLNANNLSSGTVAVARGGTGLTSPGTNGNVLTSNGTSWVSQALPAGGVTSLNGQTGAITNTSVDAIGSYVSAVRAVTAGGGTNRTSIGSTIAGSTLRYGFSINGDGIASIGSDYHALYINDNTYAGGGTALSGTWRCMSRDAIHYSSYQGNWSPGLWVRIS